MTAFWTPDAFQLFGKRRFTKVLKYFFFVKSLQNTLTAQTVFSAGIPKMLVQDSGCKRLIRGYPKNLCHDMTMSLRGSELHRLFRYPKVIKKRFISQTICITILCLTLRGTSWRPEIWDAPVATQSWKRRCFWCPRSAIRSPTFLWSDAAPWFAAIDGRDSTRPAFLKSC